MKIPTALEKVSNLYLQKTFGTITTTYLSICTTVFLICNMSQLWFIEIDCSSANFVSDFMTYNWGSVIFKLIFFPFDTTTKEHSRYVFNLITALPAMTHFERLHGSIFSFVLAQAVTTFYIITFALISFITGSITKIQGIELFNMIIWSYIIVNESKLGYNIRFWRTGKNISLLWSVITSLIAVNGIFSSFELIPKLLAIYSAILIPVLRNIIAFIFLPNSIIDKIENKIFEVEEPAYSSKIEYFKQPKEEKFGKYVSIFAQTPFLPLANNGKKNSEPNLEI